MLNTQEGTDMHVLLLPAMPMSGPACPASHLCRQVQGMGRREMRERQGGGVWGKVLG